MENTPNEKRRYRRQFAPDFKAEMVKLFVQPPGLFKGLSQRSAHVALGSLGEEEVLNHASASRRLLASAVTAALAVTVGTFAVPAAAAPALADGAAATAATAQQGDLIQIPPQSQLLSVGTTGFLTYTRATNTTFTYRWTRFADRSTTVIPGQVRGATSDTVLIEQENLYTFRDMTGASAPVEIDRSSLSSDYQLNRTIGSTLVMTVANSTGGTDIHLVSKPNGKLLDRTVTGLPKDAEFIRSDQDAPAGAMLIMYATRTAESTANHLALVDVTSGVVTETRDASGFAYLPDAVVSPERMIWTESASSSGLTLAVARRGAGDVERIVLGGEGRAMVTLLGDWLMYAQPGGGSASSPSRLYPLTARSLKTGATVKLLEHASAAGSMADGTLLVGGGTLTQGEGMYRISLGTDGTPVANLLASTGEATSVSLLGHNVPAVVDLDRNPVVLLESRLNRRNVRLVIELTHTATQRRSTVYAEPNYDYSPGTIAAQWRGVFDRKAGESGEYVTAYSGAYTWRISATPLNGIGPVAEASGALEVVRGPASHDFSDNGTPDLLSVDPSGRLTRYDHSYRAEFGRLFSSANSEIGTGWQIYDRLAVPGNLGGSAAADMVARDRSGVLWFYEGTGSPDSPYLPRKRIGGGWNAYDKLTGGSDLSGDGKPDLLATDKTGGLWLYKGTGNTTAPFSPRVKAGTGWGIYNQVTAVGNIAGGPGGDLVARDKDGVLWLYMGTSDGTFASRVKIGGGWNAYTHLVAIGDANRDGRPDLLGYSADKLYVYHSTGDWRAPFRSRYEVQKPSPGKVEYPF
ncbi:MULTISPECIES: FG-GAP-like repeat-containing protein [unclassified Streptomyces]|uniref:FG-GAP-like repeat-containing protein n=1 Tax=unclassified Streptomyces TaxID=2593676 RepID=UPI001BE800FA|nr:MULTISPECIES: FG-GAP-like repeat-containing protein [unclassified Streptomyces]MBT2408654.1 VCBS repeat-containing protein [Streptomyces sp. ISL-21]